MKMKTRLPLLLQRSVAEAKTARHELAESYDSQLRGRLAGEGASITCSKGCAHCCYHPVYITLLEGVSLYQNLQANGLWTTRLRGALEEHADKVRGLSPEVWAMSLVPCPLLDNDKLCRAYEDRPFSCRVTYSLANPENCHPHKLGPGMLPKKELLETLSVAEAQILFRHHLKHFRIPLSMAVLYGERIATGEVELEDCQTAIWEMMHA